MNQLRRQYPGEFFGLLVQVIAVKSKLTSPIIASATLCWFNLFFKNIMRVAQ
jgi:hypothetical protein